jgi:drug/metabolite transporter (DMT)-like permease
MSAGPDVGIPLALLTTTAYNLGLVLEKRALGRMPAVELRKAARLIVTLLANPAWLAGFGLMLAGLACQILVLTIEPVSVAQPILASGIALTIVLSRLILRERLGGGEYWCVAAMGIAVVLLALSAGPSGTQAGHHSNPDAMAAVIAPTVVLGLVIAASSRRAGTRKHRAPATGVGYGLGIGLLYGVAGLATKGLSAVLVAHHTGAGLVLGIASSPYLYVLGASSASAMLLYQAALQACRASILIPVTNVTGSAYVVVTGTWLFHERLPTSPVELGLRVGGFAMAGLVLVMLSRLASAPEQAPRPAVQPAPQPEPAPRPAVQPAPQPDRALYPVSPAAGRRSARAG